MSDGLNREGFAGLPYGQQNRTAGLATPEPGSAIPLADLSDREKLDLIGGAAQAYDYENRPRGRNWTAVPLDQVARLVTGALRAMEFEPPATAPAEPQPAPELRRALDTLVANWRDYSKYRPTDTRDEITDHAAVEECAGELAAILDEHPAAAQPQPAPEPHGFRAALVDAMLRWSGRDRPDVDQCASELAAILDAHPMPQPTPELAAATAHIVTDRDAHRRHRCPTCLADDVKPAPELAAAMAERDTFADAADFERKRVIDMKAMLSTLLDRTEGSGVLTDDERDEYRTRAGLTP